MKINDLIKYKGIYHQIFGDLIDKLIYKTELEKLKNNIKAMGFKDVDDMFSNEVEKQQFNKLTNIIFRFKTENDDGKNK